MITVGYIIVILKETLHLLLESSSFIIFGLVVSGIIRIFVSPDSVSRHLGQGRFGSVFKAALIGIPLPLCSCGVLPAAVSLKKQGANNGAATAFLISTPESGVDSMAITYALLDPLMTVARPVAAFFSAMTAGLLENLFQFRKETAVPEPDKACAVDGCCDGIACPPEMHRQHHTLTEKTKAGMHHAFFDVWQDMAGWFFLGLLLAGMITAFIPEDIIGRYLGGGITSMLVMLAIGVPIYICATASTPIAAALILKGVSPGAALVFLLAGPATNITSLTVLLGTLGKRATAIYLSTIAVFAAGFGLILDQCYAAFGISARAVAGSAAEMVPEWFAWICLAVLTAFSVQPVLNGIKKTGARIFQRGDQLKAEEDKTAGTERIISCNSSSCGCAHK
jgi:uncharacterized membrane protein YraQ (UPF0718 family)